MASKDKNKNKKKSRNLIDSFKYAFEGLFFGLRTIKNIRIHLLFTVIVLIGGVFFKITKIEWLICLIFIGMVISLELMNTAVEETVNLAMPNIHPVAKIAKDMAASAVLVAAIAAFIAGVIIFLPKVIGLF